MSGIQVSGRVRTRDGRGLRNVTVTMTDQNGVAHSALTSSFGYYTFTEVNAGQTYKIRAASRLYRFVTREL